ncbi:hypothetical protein [Chryseobacterium paridis]|uniref:Uncharacterized protein n=1 Tax=Chryseobacterium paridis TaxID=2800328 RepID=A0ABS1FPU5_9FLAO|nr:hypothetical protein [Chryseobacterium paridis]MBK1894274.1 hypothetical protein [Chryseobacterium paridis]
MKRYQERLKYFRKQCSSDSVKAVIDSKVENKYFIYLIAPGGDDFPAKKELGEALKKYNIIWGGTVMGSDIPLHYTDNLCYHRYMNYFTEKNFGEDFINNIIKQSILEHINENLSSIFEYNDHTYWLYEGTPQPADILINEYFFKNFTYPQSYKYSTQENQSFTEVTLELDEENYTLKLEGLNHHFENQQNEQFIPYFEKKIRNFIKSSKFALSRQNVLRGVKKSFKIYYK